MRMMMQGTLGEKKRSNITPTSPWGLCVHAGIGNRFVFLCGYYRRKYDVTGAEQLTADQAVCTGSEQVVQRSQQISLVSGD